MNSIYSESGKLLQNQDGILRETENHYKNLYAYNETKDIDLENIIHPNFKIKLSENEKNYLWMEI
jgi:hypothetical protein